MMSSLCCYHSLRIFAIALLGGAATSAPAVAQSGPKTGPESGAAPAGTAASGQGIQPGDTAETLDAQPDDKAPAAQPDDKASDALLGSDSGSAAGPDEKQASRPWAEGVSPAQRRKALSLRARGKRIAQEFYLTKAVDTYREALRHWNHPIFHYDLCRILDALDRPLEAYESLKQAMRYGPEPLGEDAATRKKRYERLLELGANLEARLVKIAIVSPASNLDISIDNRILNPGEDNTTVFLPGTHRVAAQKPGHRTLVETLDLPPGTSARFAVVPRQPVAWWKSWVVLGTGSAVALTGAGLFWYGSSERDALAKRIQDICEPGCRNPQEKDDIGRFRSDWQRVRWEQRIGLGASIVGGGVALAGAGLMLWNRQRNFQLRRVDDAPLAIVPAVSGDMTGVVGTLSF